MAVTLEGASINYTVSTPSSFAINESNLDSFVNTWLPTVKRNKTSSSASTRYIVLSVGQNTDSYNIAAYKAVFSANSKTATVTAYTGVSGINRRYGFLANTTFNRLYVSIATVSSLSSYFDSKYVSISKSVILYPTITLSVTKSQSSPSYSTFGYLKGICTATVTASIKKTWLYTDGTVTIPLVSSSISGGGKSASGTTGTSLTLQLGTLQNTSISISASAKNELGLISSESTTVTCTDYEPPEITGVTALRNNSNEKNADISVSYSLHSRNRAGTTGSIYVAYTVKHDSTTVASGSKTIYSSGTYASSLTGTVSINITGALFDVDKNYEVILTIYDRCATGNTEHDFISSTFRLLHFNPSGEGIGVGGAAPADGLEIYMPFYIHDEGSLHDLADSLGMVSGPDIDLRDLLEEIISRL